MFATTADFCESMGLPLSAVTDLVGLLNDRGRALQECADAQMESWGRGRWRSTPLSDGEGEARLEARLPANLVFNAMFKDEGALDKTGGMIAPDYLDWVLKRHPQCRPRESTGRIMVGWRGPGRKVVKRYELVS